METFTLAQTADALGVTRQAISNRIRRKSIQAIKKDGAWYIPADEVERLRNGHETHETCRNCEVSEVKLVAEKKLIETLEKQIDTLEKRCLWLEQHAEHQAMLLAQEQRRLPSPVTWFKRVFGKI